MLSKADSVPAQGVGSAYVEQVRLVKEIDSLDISINQRGDNFDIFHIHSVNLRYRLRMNKRHTNIVYVHFVPKENEGSIKLFKPFSFIFDKYVEGFYKKADELVVVNPAFIKPLEDLKISRDRITYIPNYVDGKYFYKLDKEKINELKDKYEIPKDRFVVLGCGQIQTRKGIDDFLEVCEKNPHMFFIWVGGFPFGSIMHGYRKYKKAFNNLPNNMKWLGIIPREDMNEIYNLADVFFMPSYKELFPMAILEASQLELPILLRDLTLYQPILFSKYAKGKNAKEFSNELNRLFNDKDYYEKQSINSRNIKNFYSKNRLLEEWKKYYERIYKKYHQ